MQAGNLLKSNPILYFAYFQFFGDRTLKFPSSKTKITLEGFPRSANTYSVHLAEQLVPREYISSHFHNLASIKMSLRLKKPTFVLLRDPVDAVVSMMLLDSSKGNRYRKTKCDQLFSSYIHFYAEVLKLKKRSSSLIEIVRFEEIISTPDLFLKRVSNALGIKIDQKEIQERIKRGKSEAVKAEESKPILRSSLPNTARQEFAGRIKQELQAQHSAIRAKEFFSEICSSL